MPLLPSTPLSSLVSQIQSSSSIKKAVIVSPSSPPIPFKLADAIWQGEYIDTAKLLPSQLGAEEPTLVDLFDPEVKARKKERCVVTQIEQWVQCFNSYIAIVAMKHPGRVQHLLAYSSGIVKASQDFEGTPWRTYDQLVRRRAAVDSSKNRADVRMNSWTQAFGTAIPRGSDKQE